MPPPKLTRDARDALAVYGYLLLSARQTAKAHALFKGMRVLFPDDAHVTRSLAVTSLATGDAAGALALADQAAAANGHDDAVVLDFIRSQALYTLGRFDQARKVLETALIKRQTAADAAANKEVNGRTP